MEKNMSAVTEKKQQRLKLEASKNGFYVVEKCYNGVWAPLWLDMQCTYDGALDLLLKRLKNFPKENLCVSLYVRE
jgi:hypothetical protein